MPPGSGGKHPCLDTELTDLAKLTALIAPQAEALGFDLVRVKLFGGAGDITLQVMAERPDTRQLGIDDCAELSRRISDVMDEADPIGSEYRLEVSSPGIDRPLTRLKDFADWAEHEVRIHLAAPVEGRKVLTGMLKGVGVDGAAEDRITIDLPKHGLMTIGFEQVGNAKLVLTDALIAATRPLDTTGAEFEEIEDDEEALDSVDSKDEG